MKKRILSVLLCAVIMFGLLPTTAFAADGGNISNIGLDLTTPPTVETTYQAGVVQ